MQHYTILRNEFVTVIRTADGISWADLTDHHNDFRGFTRNKRGLNKAELYIKGLAPEVKSGIKMGDITSILTRLNLRPHTYCGMD